jgi:hypothetical protein
MVHSEPCRRAIQSVHRDPHLQRRRGKESGELVLATLRHGECLSADCERPCAIPAAILGGLERHRAVSGS